VWSCDMIGDGRIDRVSGLSSHRRKPEIWTELAGQRRVYQHIARRKTKTGLLCPRAVSANSMANSPQTHSQRTAAPWSEPFCSESPYQCTTPGRRPADVSACDSGGTRRGECSRRVRHAADVRGWSRRPTQRSILAPAGGAPPPPFLPSNSRLHGHVHPMQ